MKTNQHDTDNQLRAVLVRFPQIVLAVLFGSIALGHQRSGSDIDIALGPHPGRLLRALASPLRKYLQIYLIATNDPSPHPASRPAHWP